MKECLNPDMNYFKDYTFLIMRILILESQVSSKTKNLMKGDGREVSLRYYSYRVEFQARAMFRKNLTGNWSD